MSLRDSHSAAGRTPRGSSPEIEGGLVRGISVAERHELRSERRWARRKRAPQRTTVPRSRSQHWGEATAELLGCENVASWLRPPGQCRQSVSPGMQRTRQGSGAFSVNRNLRLSRYSALGSAGFSSAGFSSAGFSSAGLSPSGLSPSGFLSSSGLPSSGLVGIIFFSSSICFCCSSSFFF